MRSAIYRRLHRRFGPADELPTRRQVLRRGLAAAASLYLSSCSSFGRRPPRSGTGPRVVVVGAGFAGLACAFELAGSGYRVTVLEARQRLGGRVHTLADLVPRRTVEAGASLIGANHPTWLGYAERFGLELLDVVDEPEEAASPIVLDGRRLPAAEAEVLYEGLAAFEAAMGEESAVVGDPERPWTAPGAGDLDRRSLGARLDALGLAPEVRRLAEIIEASNNCAPTDRQSLLAMLSAVRAGGGAAYFTDSEVYRCRGGNHRLVEALAGGLGDTDLQAGTPVTRIDYGGPVAQVTTAAGAVWEADQVVLAVPPSTWSKISFDPPLPADLTPTVGPAVKVLSAVDRPYWQDDGWSQYGVGDGAVAMVWDGTYRQAAGGPAALIGFSGGDAASTCLAVPRNERQGFFAAQLEAFFPGYGIHRSRDAAFVRWPQDPWTLTGYSSPAPGDVTRIGARLAAGLGRLRFAGEHTSWSFFGYMEGGLRSGARLARQLAEEDGLVEPSATDRRRAAG